MSIRDFRTVGCIFGALAAAAAPPITESEAAPSNHPRAIDYREGTLLVRFATQAAEPARVAKRKRFAAHKLKGLDRLVPGLEIWTLPKHLTVSAALAALRGDPDLLYAEPDHILHADIVPNDPSFSSMWGLRNAGQTGGTPDADIDAPEAWESTVGSSDVVVGVVDTGIDYRHPDLAPNMWVNPGEVPGNGVDDDANGFVDDVHGWNAVANNGDPLDDHRHGTHVAGTIGARGNNGVGVVGVNWNVKLMALKFLNASGTGTTADAIQAIDYAVAQKRRGVNVRVLNNSWGGGNFNRALLNSIAAAERADILFVAAAGNASTDNDVTPTYPASYDLANVVSVAATTHTDALATFSNFGATSVDLGAPGASILSTTPNASYASFSGTSMATPHVSGVAALMLSLQPTLSASALKADLLHAVDPVPSLAGKTVTGGRLNAQKAVGALGPATASFQLSATPSSAFVSQGRTASFSVAVTPTSGFAGDVTLSLSSSPALQGTTVSITPNPVAAGATATVSIAPTTATALGTYALTITGVSGNITRSTSVNLTVDPAGTTTLSARNSTAIAIPDADPSGIASAISLPDQLVISSASIAVDITHTYIGDLEVALISPAGTRVILHNQAGGSADNIHQTYAVSAFNGQSARGTWTLTVRDLVALDVGTLDGWTLTLKGSSSAPPLATGTVPLNAGITSPLDHATVGGSIPIQVATARDDEVGEVYVAVDGVSIGTIASPPYELLWNTQSVPEGSHTLSALAVDLAGKAGAPWSMTVDVDHTAPRISAVQPTAISRDGAAIAWSTDEASMSQVEYGTSSAYGSLTSVDTHLRTEHRMALDGMKAGTLYHYRVRSSDAAGNVSVSGDLTFQTARSNGRTRRPAPHTPR